ncbi:hypothetical protein FB381_1586 [Nocardioides albertanoniae]|uniref:Glycosyl hydrolase family 25 n=1 Tax=Nocardioides albertanoniae TaxID=1175486 RepID=A0A543A575_9ACTN|nr:hypothetical protein [Nocardioides albertanoniae]TQL67704.1 hypothetical protein FB381_1586 [Nocardioides albertanoniae]
MWPRKIAYAGVLLLAAAPMLLGCAAEPEADAESASPSAPAAPGSSSSAPTSPSPQTSLEVPSVPPAEDRGIVEGGDMSWPQCPKGMGIKERRTLGLPMPLDSAEFVIIGLSNGPAFRPNPCLASQAEWAKERKLMTSAYAIVSFPEKKDIRERGGEGPGDPSTRTGQLTNVGYQQARWNLDQMKRAGLESPSVWIDVEPVKVWEWSNNIEQNQAVVKGAVQGYRDAGKRVGVYSISGLWTPIVGDLQLQLPEWRPAGETSREAALERCDGEWMFQGGAAVIVQWLEDDRDRNVTCPGESVQLPLWFHQP